MSQPVQTLEQIFDAHIRVLATTLRPNTVALYRYPARHFLSYLHTVFPQVRKLSQLRRDPHLLGWFRWLCEQHPPLSNKTRELYLLVLRRLFQDLIDNGHSLQPDLIRREDFPPPARYLPKPLSPEDDQRLDQELRHTDDLHPMLCCSSALPGSASANVSIFLWIACGRWENSCGHFMYRSASSTRNVSCQLMTTSGAFSLAFWLCAVWILPPARCSLTASYSPAASSVMPCTALSIAP